jgi:hypothetical protein
MFWDIIICHVSATVVALAITTCYEGNLCYGLSAAAVLLQCSLLKDLTLGMVEPSVV